MIKQRITFIITIIIIFLGVAMVLQADKESAQNIRPPAVAGKFYPESGPVLKQAIEQFVAEAKPAGVKSPLAIIAPHAGYIYSGQICADAYNQVRQNAYDTVVILGTNHTSPRFDKIALYPGDGFKTPLGVARIDRDIVSRLQRINPDCLPDASVHAAEHSVEVQVPFVQVLFPQAKIVAAVVGRADEGLCRRFGESLAEVLRGRRALIVASTDLSHYPTYDDAVKIDGEILRSITRMAPGALQGVLQAGLSRRIPNLHTGACGEAPILTAMWAAKGLGARGAKIISYANSGDVAIGQPDRVVGYGAVAFTGEAPLPDQEAPATAVSSGTDLPAGDKKGLLALARKTVTWYLHTQTVPLARGFSAAVEEPRGVFVTLKKRGHLRGCIGRIIPHEPLGKLVGIMALQSAFNDNRFPQVTAGELKDIEFELSVLTPAKAVAGPEAIVLGRDGVIIEKDGHSAVFLPQVATEQGWSREEMLDQLSRKAGLSAGSWRQGCRFSTFQAIVFSESDFW